MNRVASFGICIFLHSVVHDVVIDRSKLESDAHTAREFECGGQLGGAHQNVFERGFGGRKIQLVVHVHGFKPKVERQTARDPERQIGFECHAVFR